MNIALISGETKVVIVENTIAQESINTVGIFKLGRSSKGEGRGIGLSTVREILGKYPNCSLSTQSKDYRFKQTLKNRRCGLIMTKKTTVYDFNEKFSFLDIIITS